jgi:hypothetical protein
MIQSRHLSINKRLDILQPPNVFLKTHGSGQKYPRRKKLNIALTFCSLYSAYSGMNTARLSLMPRSARNFSNSSWTDTSKVSNCHPSQPNVLIENDNTSYLRANVKPATLPVCLRRQLCGELRVLVKGNVVCNKGTVLAHGVDRQRTTVIALAEKKSVNVIIAFVS